MAEHPDVHREDAMSFFVYILQSNKTGKYYIGSTNNLERRLREHNGGHTASLRSQRPLSVVFTQGFTTRKKARSVEQKLKKLKNRTILDRIIIDREIKLGL